MQFQIVKEIEAAKRRTGDPMAFERMKYSLTEKVSIGINQEQAERLARAKGTRF